MKADSSLNVRMNKEVKLKAQELFSAMGIDVSSAINVFLIKAIAVQGFPFDVRLEPNPTTYNAMQSAENDDDMHGPFDSVEALMEALDAED